MISRFEIIKKLGKSPIFVNHYNSFLPKHEYYKQSFMFFNSINHNIDLIVINGLHIKEYVYLDICNSLVKLSETGFICVLDCNPLMKVHSCDLNEYSSGAWCGKSYEAFIEIKRELKDWSCFVVDEDWGVGIITKNPILKNNISSCPYYNWKDFDKNREEVLQLISYEKFLKIIR